MLIFVATRAEAVPAGLHHFLSVDGSVPGAALCWDHHQSGERINLEAMPEQVDPSAFDGIGTTLADTDALASMIAVLAGGKGRLAPEVRAVLEAASHRCDHLVPHPDHPPSVDRAGHRLHAWVCGRLKAALDPSSGLAQAVAEVWAGLPELPGQDPTTPEQQAWITRILAERCQIEAGVALLDMQGTPGLPLEVLYAALPARMALLMDRHHGGFRYTVGVNPFHPDPPRNLHPFLLRLAQEEFRHGPPCLSPEPVAGAENWGGRATVFGSPWNYASRLSPETVWKILRLPL